MDLVILNALIIDIFIVSTYCMNKLIPIRADEYHLSEILLLKGSKRLEIYGKKHMVITT